MLELMEQVITGSCCGSHGGHRNSCGSGVGGFNCCGCSDLSWWCSDLGERSGDWFLCCSG